MKKRFNTGYLFSTPSFLSGVGTVINLAGDFYEFNYSENADRDAIQNDFNMIGQDINDVIEDLTQGKTKLAS